MNNLLEVRSLHTLYGDSHILHGISFDIAPGQAVSLMGRNGMGKTTTLKSILGVVTPRSGQVRFQGKSSTPCPPGSACGAISPMSPKVAACSTICPCASTC
ncbi:ATP-binding cassette domain-containing protein [Marinobacterium aestuariivivens]|uniref:ATP-binding cassette domain-containing protein n=1 Tax=Marinobacterium aestuariivivens TaxID=1698799 RepID=A0ABW1ZVF7_9GAMM